MAMFLAEISFSLELALFAAGLVLWHRGREATAGLLRTAGAVLIVGSVLTALCTGYYSVRYHVQGGFDHAYSQHHAMAMPGMGPGGRHPHHPGMVPGMMGGQMHPGMQPGMGMPPGMGQGQMGGERPGAEEPN